MSELYLIASGTVTRDAEIRETKGKAKKSFLSLSFSAGARKTDKGWEGGTWVNVQGYPEYLHDLASQLTKGTFVTVRGRAQGSSYEKDGEMVQQILLFADSIQFPRERQETVAAGAKKSHSRYTKNGDAEESDTDFA